jgi:hypothetical protein
LYKRIKFMYQTNILTTILNDNLLFIMIIANHRIKKMYDQWEKQRIAEVKVVMHYSRYWLSLLSQHIIRSNHIT